MKQATFYLERVIEDGRECIKILNWENVPRESELPLEYKNGTPCFLSLKEEGTKKEDETIRIEYNHTWLDLYIGSVILKEQWEELEEAMKQAKRRLLKIKKQKWYGKFKVEI